MNRIKMIDALRGFALLGILLVNVFVFHAPYVHYGEFYGSFEGINSIALETIIFACGGKFMFLFSFLFGWGAWIQFHRRGSQFGIIWTSRMTVLMILGLLHVFLLWWGDILLAYGLFGLSFLAVSKWKTRSIFLLIVLLFLFNGFWAFLSIQFNFDPYFRKEPDSLQAMIQLYSEGGYFEILAMRMREWNYFLPEQLLGYVPKQMVAMYLGFIAGKTNWLTSSRSWSWGALLIAMVFSVGFGIYRYSFFSLFDLENYPLWRPPLILLNEAVSLLVGVIWLMLFKKLWNENSILVGLANLGRMSLSHYILQSIICVVVFNGFGLGMYGQWTPIALISFGFCLFGFQLLLANTLLNKMKQGPLEKLYRRGSERVAQLIRNK